MRTIEHPPATTVRTGQFLRDLLAISRPRFWCLSVMAVQLGFVLATHRIIPRGPELVTMANAALVTGPLLWLSALSINDAHDLTSDLINPRKAGSPLVAGRITPAIAIRAGAIAGGLAVLAAIPLGGWFALGTALVVLLGWAYSAPPLRLKGRAGVDVAVNAGTVGVLGPLAGWVAMTGTPDRFPWPIALVGLLAVAALYLPTTLVDHDADRRRGVRTIAVALGRRATFELGFALWAGSALLALGLAATGTVIDASLVPLHLLMAPVLLVLYRSLLKDRPSFTAVLVVASGFALPCAAFALTYVDSI